MNGSDGDIMGAEVVMAMTIEEKLSNLKDHDILERDRLYEFIREVYPRYTDSSIRWVIYDLVKKGFITKLDPTRYMIGQSDTYHQKNASDERHRIVDELNQAFPDIRIVVFESTLLNEWVNHQIARKVIFIEVERYFVKDVFRMMHERYPQKVILDANKEQLYMYGGELIIITRLISQAPVDQQTRDIKIEKLLVDLYTKDLIAEFVNEDEKDDMIESIFKTYPVNVKTVYAYAKRRGNIDRIKEAISSYEPAGLT
jgi:hypothetical protein